MCLSSKEIGKLAIECLMEKIEDRPDMKEVAEWLVMLRRARKHGRWNLKSPQQFEENITISVEQAALQLLRHPLR